MVDWALKWIIPPILSLKRMFDTLALMYSEPTSYISWFWPPFPRKTSCLKFSILHIEFCIPPPRRKISCLKFSILYIAFCISPPRRKTSCLKFSVLHITFCIPPPSRPLLQEKAKSCHRYKHKPAWPQCAQARPQSNIDRRKCVLGPICRHLGEVRCKRCQRGELGNTIRERGKGPGSFSDCPEWNTGHVVCVLPVSYTHLTLPTSSEV